MYEVWNSSNIILNHFLYHHFDLIEMDEVKVENLFMCNYDALQSFHSQFWNENAISGPNSEDDPGFCFKLWPTLLLENSLSLVIIIQRVPHMYIYQRHSVGWNTKFSTFSKK